jgi:aspartate-semialdehyde dehydrogenase
MMAPVNGVVQMEETLGKAAIAGAAGGIGNPMITCLEESSLKAESVGLPSSMRSVGRIRRDESIPDGIHLWVVADKNRKGAATDTVQIAEGPAGDYLRCRQQSSIR